MLKRERCITLKEVSIVTGKGALSLALVVMICVGAFVHLNISSDNVVSAEEGTKAQALPWAMFRGDLNNTGFSESSVPSTNDSYLEFIVPAEPQPLIFSSVIYHDFKIYFGTYSNFTPFSIELYSVDAYTGAEIWSNSTDGSIEATPLIVDDVLYVGDLMGSMYAFDASSGEQVWKVDLAPISSSAKYYNGSIFFGAKDGKFYSLNATTGIEEWNFTTGNEILSSPAIADGYVYFGSLDGNVYCLWENNGTKKWSHQTGHQVYSSPAVHQGKIFIGTSDSAGPTNNGSLLALNASEGGLIWAFNTTAYVYSSPAVHDGRVFFGTAPSVGDSYIYSLPEEDPSPGDGIISPSEILWKKETFESFEGGSSPTVADGKVLIGSRAGRMLYCFNETTGEEIWHFDTDNGVISSPLIIDGRVFIGSLEGVVYGIGSSGLPKLDITILPEASSVKGGQTLKISFLVTHTNQPVEGAFISVSVTDGSLTQSGFSTFDDGTQSVKFVAPAVEANLTVTITAEVTKYGFDDGIAAEVFVVEPAEKYETETTDNLGEYLIKYSPFLIAVVVLVILNILVLLSIRRRRRSQKNENMDEGQGMEETEIMEDKE
jgi:outer membrane protein assembly factor BamB